MGNVPAQQEDQMPLRLTMNETTLSGQHYDDVVGVRYEFPQQYRKLVRSGRRFVSYRGRRRVGGGSQPQTYLGVCIVGEVRKAGGRSNRLVCDIEDWRLFPSPLFFKDSSGRYYEPGAARGGFYWQAGVRWIDEAIYERIVRDATTAGELGAGQADAAAPVPVGREDYAAGDLAKAVDDFAMTTALTIVADLWPNEVVERQPHNNPGYDIRIGPPTTVERYVEVKGTTLPYPRFFLSEGERVFSLSESTRYTLLVIHSINLANNTYRLLRHDGAIEGRLFTLTPRQWICESQPTS
jgi:Domain of unknown function (DUF3883)